MLGLCFGFLARTQNQLRRYRSSPAIRIELAMLYSSVPHTCDCWCPIHKNCVAVYSFKHRFFTPRPLGLCPGPWSHHSLGVAMVTILRCSSTLYSSSFSPARHTIYCQQGLTHLADTALCRSLFLLAYLPFKSSVIPQLPFSPKEVEHVWAVSIEL